MAEAQGHGGQPSADSNLENLGYVPELSRNRSTWQVMFMSFIMASVPYTISTTMTYTMTGGGPSNMIWGWVTICLFMLCLGASLAEITSVFPTAGGVYYQTFALSPPWCRRVMAWICGWCYFAGQVTITLSVNFGTTLFFIEALNLFKYADGTGFTENFEAWQTYLIFLGITLFTHILPSIGNKWLTYVELFAVFWVIGGIIATIVTILVVADHGRRPGRWVFGGFEPHSGWPDGWSFCIGLLQCAYSLSATGMVTSMCEEVRRPAVQVPNAIVGAVIMNMVAGLTYMIPIAFVLPDTSMLSELSNPIPTIFLYATGNQVGAFCLCIPIIILGICSGITCVTSTSRCTWAFARDRAVPGSRWLKIVNKRLEIPFNALLLGMVIELLLGLIYFGSSAAFSAFSGVGVIFLTLSYTLPVACSFFLRGRKDLKYASYHLGKLGVLCNVVSISWCLLAIPLFCMPTAIPVSRDSMNYAVVVFVGIIIISAVWYIISGHKNYHGPPSEGLHIDSGESQEKFEPNKIPPPQ
ncbi:putative amino acid permease [Aspergillus ruber CBS 135680]|uniref:Putative amino acid permease n=1 Tax=Aspergillus ruber (strain CBS 135680) TaxID=1388766 RepID=A0A017S4Q8_ASPRC|nr:putative amino acid permease [Aspergillus ruber CBS 135680]EYE92003.1 putative amino acid permease [Aspergillus ruber CBS 135680]